MTETGVPGENHWPVANHWQTLSHNGVSSAPRLNGVRTHNVSGGRHLRPRRPLLQQNCHRRLPNIIHNHVPITLHDIEIVATMNHSWVIKTTHFDWYRQTLSQPIKSQTQFLKEKTEGIFLQIIKSRGNEWVVIIDSKYHIDRSGRIFHNLFYPSNRKIWVMLCCYGKWKGEAKQRL